MPNIIMTRGQINPATALSRFLYDKLHRFGPDVRRKNSVINTAGYQFGPEIKFFKF